MSAYIPIVTTLLAAFVAAALSIRSYRNQKEIDRRNDLRKQQRTAYEIYMQSYYDWTFTESDSEDEREKGKIYSTAYFKLFPLASDDFIRAAMAFHTYAWLSYPNFAEEKDRNTFEELWTNLVVQMRDDAIVQSELTRQEISTHLPWYWGSRAQKD